MRAFFVFILNSFFVLSSTAQDMPRTTVIQNVRLFDGEHVIPRCTVVVCDDKIEAVGQKISVPDGAEVIRGEGKTLLPGLIDAHVHVVSEEALKQSLIFGVTTVVDMFMSTELMTSIKKKQSSGETKDMASLVSAGTLVTAPGGHGTQFVANFCDDKFDEDFGRYVSQYGAFVVPTLTVLENVSVVSGASTLIEDFELQIDNIRLRKNEDGQD